MIKSTKTRDNVRPALSWYLEQFNNDEIHPSARAGYERAFVNILDLNPTRRHQVHDLVEKWNAYAAGRGLRQFELP
jgi:hypothetical protein